MTNLIKYYITSWVILTLIWIFLLIKNHKEIILFHKDYFSFLLVRWKIVTFLLATSLLSLISTFGFDPSWDIPETIIMWSLTYLTAPYVIWIIYRFFRFRNIKISELYISVIILIFTSSWFYDAYATIFLLGFYPPMFLANLWLSPFFYVLAGMLWSLDYKDKKWIIFAYTETNWLDYKWTNWWFKKIFLYTIPIMLFMIVVFGWFVVENWR